MTCNLWICEILREAVYEKLYRNVNTIQEMFLKQQLNVLLCIIFFPPLLGKCWVKNHNDFTNGL